MWLSFHCKVNVRDMPQAELIECLNPPGRQGFLEGHLKIAKAIGDVFSELTNSREVFIDEMNIRSAPILGIPLGNNMIGNNEDQEDKKGSK